MLMWWKKKKRRQTSKLEEAKAFKHTLERMPPHIPYYPAKINISSKVAYDLSKYAEEAFVDWFGNVFFFSNHKTNRIVQDLKVLVETEISLRESYES